MSAAPSPERALIEGLVAALKADAGVRAHLGERIYPERPTQAAQPFLAFGRIESRALGGALAPALEHAVTATVAARERATAQDATAAVRAALDGAGIAVSGVRLVSLFVPYTDVFAGDGRSALGVLRLRAVTE